jgi:hypothetical protein
MNSRKGQHPKSPTKKSIKKQKIPLYESNTHILELSKKPPYNPTQHAKAPYRQRATTPPQSAGCNSKKNRRQSQTMPKTERQHDHARGHASTPGLISGPAL